MSTFELDRRALLGFGAAACAAPLTAAAAQFTATGMAWQPNTTAFPTAVDLRAGYVFFTPDEAAAEFLE